MTDEQIARRMYQAYNDQGPNPWRTFDGRTVPTWDEINDQVRGKWGAAAKEARARMLTTGNALVEVP